MMRFAVVPAHNEVKTISDVVQKLKLYTSQVIVVDDHSSDGTGEMAGIEGALVITNSKNIGYEGSLFIGIRMALAKGASHILTFDADGQHPHECIPEIFRLIEEGKADLVIGTRATMPRLSEKIFAQYTFIRYNVRDVLCGMKCYSSIALRQTGLQPGWDSIGTFITLKALQLNLKVASFPIKTHQRVDGVSRYGINLIAEYKILYALWRFLLYSWIRR